MLSLEVRVISKRTGKLSLKQHRLCSTQAEALEKVEHDRIYFEPQGYSIEYTIEEDTDN